MMNDNFEEWDNKDWTITYTIHGTYHIQIPGEVTYVFNEHDFQVLKKRINEAEQDKNNTANEIFTFENYDGIRDDIYYKGEYLAEVNKEDTEELLKLLNSLYYENESLKRKLDFLLELTRDTKIR